MTLLGINQTELPWIDNTIDKSPDVTQIITGIAGLGASAIRLSCLWVMLDPGFTQKYENGSGAAAWALLDSAIDQSLAAGLEILLCIEPQRALFQLEGIDVTTSNATNFGLLCGHVAARYTTQIKWYEIGNEVNNVAYFGNALEPSKYVELLIAASTAITTADSSALIVACALQGAPSTATFTNSAPDFVTEFYLSNPQAYFDLLSIHPYCTNGGFDPIPVTPTANPFLNLAQVAAIMAKNGDGAKKILITEMGFDSIRSVYGNTTQPTLEAEQAMKLEQEWAILQTFVTAGTVDPTIFIFDYRDWAESLTSSYTQHYGIVRFDYTPKAALAWVRSLNAPTTITPNPATAVAQAWPPTITQYINPSAPLIEAATATGQAFPPSVTVSVTPNPATATAQAYAPTVTNLAEVQYVSTGTGVRNTTTGFSTTITPTITVTSVADGLLLLGLVCSTDHVKPWSLYSTLSVSSSINGALTRLGSRQISSTTFQFGSVHIFGLTNPTAGSHTLTVSVATSDGVTNFTSVAADSVLYEGVGSLGTVYGVNSSSGGNTPTLTATSVVDDMVFFVFGGSGDFNASFTGATARYHAGSSVAGEGDYTMIADAPGALSVTATASIGGTQYGALAIDLKHP